MNEFSHFRAALLALGRSRRSRSKQLHVPYATVRDWEINGPPRHVVRFVCLPALLMAIQADVAANPALCQNYIDSSEPEL